MTARFDLEPGEERRMTAIARVFVPSRPGSIVGRGGDGRLHLTTRRVIWKPGYWTRLPFIAPSFDVALADMAGCQVVGDTPSHLLGVRGLIIERLDGSQVKFAVAKTRLWPPAWWFSKSEAERWCRAISTLLGE